MSDMTIQNAIHCMKAIICEEVCEECDYYGKTGIDHCEADAVRMAIKALEEQPHWTPCSERLPLTYEDNIPVSETYIVTVNVDGALFVDKAYSFGTYIDGFWDTVNDWDEGNDVHVLAWMPQPEPYRGESE